MKFLVNFPIFNGCLRDFGNMSALAEQCRKSGVSGLEVIWDYDPYTEEMPPKELVVGYHLKFWANWVDFWNGDRDAVMKEFGSWDKVREYYHGEGKAEILEQYREDLQRAIDLEAEYVVFHVSEVSLDECFTYDFVHTDEQVIDASIECINSVFDGVTSDVVLLMENQWWPGLTYTNPKMTKRLLDGVEWPNKGIMLDTGHLLHTNNKLRTQKEAARYIIQMHEDHRELGEMVRGMHLHQSLTGAYVESQGYKIPDDVPNNLPEDYWKKLSRVYDHILKIDCHQPWTDPCVADVVRAIDPEWVNNELASWPSDEHFKALDTQMGALAAGGLAVGPKANAARDGK
ncbi:MAG: TIM barrel protein [Coriobacteriales bacterium]